MTKDTLHSKYDRSVAATRLEGPQFGDGEWHRLTELQNFEMKLWAKRQEDKDFSDAVRTDTSREEILRRDELVPFLLLAKHDDLPANTRFRKLVQKGTDREKGIDIAFQVPGSGESYLQITKAFPVWSNATARALNEGYQHRLFMEKLTAEDTILGSGPFKRCGSKILLCQSPTPCSHSVHRS